MYKIFMVEDDKFIAEIYQHKIEAEGYLVEIAYDGEIAFEKLQSYEPDLLFTMGLIPRQLAAAL